MKVKYSQLAKVLTITPAAITMAITRDNLNKTLDNMIDLDDLKNHTWIQKKLLKQGREVTDISTLFRATPITDNNKIEQKNNVIPESDIEPQLVLTPEQIEIEKEIAERSAERSKELAELSLRDARAKTKDTENKAELSRLKIEEQSRELIKINPLARLLFYIVSALRTQIINIMPNLAQVVLDDIKSALINDLPKEKKITDAEIRLKMQERWLNEITKIFKNTDSELKNKIRQIKKKPDITEIKVEPEAENAGISN